MEKKLFAFDNNEAREETSISRKFDDNSSYYDTEIIFKDLETGEVLHKDKNKVVLAGGDMVARKLFDLPGGDVDTIPTYNEELGIVDPGPEDEGVTHPFTKATKTDPKVLLFCVGTDGCGTEGSQIYAVNYNSRIPPEHIIPLRYPMKDNDIDEDLQEIYTGRVEQDNYIAYYFKRFSTDPTLHREYNDGTPIEHNVYETKQEVNVYVELTLKITKEDIRQFFIATTGIDQCRFNSLSLCYAYPRIVGGKTYYMDIRPLTKLNISNEYMIDVTKGVEVIYHIYF